MDKFLEERNVEHDLELALDVIEVPEPTKIKKTQEQLFAEKMAVFENEFIIPEMPRGRKLEFNIVQTWGDINYLGLTGIEVFDGEGLPIKLEASCITATPCDINLLMGYGNDPRTVDKLIDGSYFTQDDFHAWLTPFTQGEDHTITIDLGASTNISLIRFWNYNKSRIHSHRGARLVSATLDGTTIFRGEIKRAPGNTNDLAACCELLLFTEDDEVMANIDANDWVNEVPIREEAPTEDAFEAERPMTADGEANLNRDQAKPKTLFDDRPQTRAVRTVAPDFNEADNEPNMDLDEFEPKVIKKTKERKLM